MNSLACPHCKKKTCQIRKEGTSKFFISTKKSQFTSKNLKFKINWFDFRETKNIDIQENDDQNEIENKTPSKPLKEEKSQLGNREKTKKQNFLNPLEVFMKNLH